MITTSRRDLVLVGGGHSHVQVLRNLVMKPLPEARVTLVVDTPIAVYSGMLPGWVAGQYRRDELEIDVNPLAARAGVRVIVGRMTGIDPIAHRIEVSGRPPVSYDFASIDIGSRVANLDLPGVAALALATRPIARLVENLDAFLAQAAARARGRALRVVVVGGGAGGVELCFTLERRLRNEAAAGQAIELTLVQGEQRILPGYPASLQRLVANEAKQRGIAIRCPARVVGAVADAVQFEDGSSLPVDALVWVAGAVSQPVFRDSGLPVDSRGFVLIEDDLTVKGHADLFATGDCATLINYPKTPKAGVYAVRQGPTLIDNLRAAVAGEALERYRPQSDFLTLLNLGDGRALGAKWGFAFEGAWVMRLKDRIDRRFMERFQLLDRFGVPATRGAALPAMTDADGAGAAMLCGGCAAKVGEDVLGRALRRVGPGPAGVGADVVLGLDVPDDAAALRTPGGDVLVWTIDAFRGLTGDAWLLGRIAAVNAVSDLLAKGVRPRHALALVAVPEHEDAAQSEETLFQTLAGARHELDALGIALLGGHTTTSADLMVGFSITGFADPALPLLRIDGLAVGQVLLLSKPLGTGVLFNADARGLCTGPWRETAIASMLRLNASAMTVANACGATAATDVTGFGLAIHLAQLARASGVTAILDVARLPALPGAVELLGRGERSTSHAQNERARRAVIVTPAAAAHARLPLMFDPQTSGGVVFGVPESRAEEALARLHSGGDTAAAVVGRIVPRRGDGAVLELIVGS